MSEADDLRVLQQLLAEGSALPPGQLEGWLDRLPLAQQRYRLQLRAMLAPTRVPGETVYDRAATTRGVDTLGPLAALDAGSMIGPYRLERELGHGGMGTVWLARRTDGTLDRAVALKLPFYGPQGRSFAERFARERDILASLAHPNIAGLYDAGVSDAGQPYLAMEWVDGVPIDEYCDAHRLTVDARIALFSQALAAVHYAHRNLVLHRDLKPGNILVTPDGQVKLLDFGIAKLMTEGRAHETHLTAVEGRALTPDYASPEQVVGAPLTTASDVYSLGVVLYELLCGARPYQPRRDSRGALDDAILSAEPPRPSQQITREPVAAARAASVKRLRAALRGDLDTIVLKALKKLPAERYDTAHDFAADLRRHERGEPVLARPDSAWYSLRKFVGRHRVAVGSSAVVALALVIGLGTAVWQAQVARHEQARAEAVRAFLVGVFGKANPAIGLGGDARVSQLLRESEQRVATELGGNPELAAEMYNLIAEGLWNLGQGDDAERAARLALDTATRSLSPDDLQRLRALHIIADVEVNAGRLRDAEPLLTEVIARLRASHDAARAPHLVNALAVQSLWYADQGDRPRAIGVAREAVDLARGLRPANYPVLLTALSALADRLLVAAKYDEAVIVAREAADIAETLYGAQRPHMLLSDSELNLGNALLRNGRPADALPLLQRVVVDTRQALGVENRQMSVALQAVGDALATQGRLQDSLLYFDGALAIEQRLSPTLTPRAISLQQRVANVRLNLREADAAAAAYDQIIRGWATMGGPLATALSRQAQIARALAWAYQGRQYEALVALQDLAAASAGATPLERVWILLTQSNVERWLGRRREAVRDARQATDQLADTAHAPRDAAGAQATLGLALLEAGEDAEARQTLQGAVHSFERLQMTRTPVAMDVALGLGRLELKAGDVQAAESHFATADAYWSKTAPESRWAGEAKCWLALARQRQGRLDDAALLRRSARDVLRHSPWMSDQRWAQAL